MRRFIRDGATVSIDYLVCPHCTCEIRKGVTTCTGCAASVSYGPPRPLLIATLLPSLWLAFASHRFFYDSVLVSLLLGGIVYGGVWAMLSMAYDDRAIFNRPAS